MQYGRLLKPKVAAAALMGGVAFVALAPSPRPVARDGKADESACGMLRVASTSTLIKTYVVYKTCQIPAIVDRADGILAVLEAVPGLRQLSHLIVRHTFFEQFVGGDTAAECLPVMQRLRRAGIGSLLNYSVEVQEPAEPPGGFTAAQVAANQQAALKGGWANVEETIRAVQVCGEENARELAQTGGAGSAWIAIKLTGLTDPGVLHRVSDAILRDRARRNVQSLALTTPYPGSPSEDDARLVQTLARKRLPLTSSDPHQLVASDVEYIKRLYEDTRRIMLEAQKQRVRIILDAEHTWYQPATDVIQMMLSAEFNKIPAAGDESTLGLPLLYGTYQAYLQRNLRHIESSLQHAKANGYCLGVKIVRGAYHGQELDHWRETNPKAPPPVWPTKAETDACYNASMSLVMKQMADDARYDAPTPSCGILLATHNVESAEMLLDELKRYDLVSLRGKGLELKPAVRDRVTLGQLYGMSDDLTCWIASQFSNTGSPVVLKYIPYGALVQVMPYLSRRAIENKAMLSGDRGAKLECDRTLSELKRRLLFLGGILSVW